MCADGERAKPRVVIKIADAQVDPADFRPEQLGPVVAPLFANAIPSLAFKNFSHSLSKYFAETLAHLQPVLELSARQIEAEIERSCYGRLELAKRGWFPDPYTPFRKVKDLGVLLGDSSVDVDQAMAELFRCRLQEIQENLIREYPRRGKLLGEAFWAHHEGKYSLSATAFLVQADGLWYDRFSTGVFTRKDRDSSYTRFTSQLQSPMGEPLAALLTDSLPLWMNQGEREESFDGFNRHQVLHGMKYNYGELESLKGLSFLTWSAWMLRLRHDSG